MIKRALIIGNGREPNIHLFKKILKFNFDLFICADGAANYLYKHKIFPDVIIGDLDSISENALKFFNGKCLIKKIKRQNDTDLEKAIKYSIKKKCVYALLIGITGRRLDHTIGNLALPLKFYDEILLSIVNENSVLIPVTGNKKIEVEIGEQISLYGFDDKTKITVNGLKYRLKKESLPFGLRESTSNVAINNNIELDIKGGVVYLIRELNKVLKHDIFF